MLKITKDGCEVDTDRLCAGIARNLRQFGYPDVTTETVYNALSLPKGERGIIGMFAEGILDDNGLVLADADADAEVTPGEPPRAGA